MDEYSLNLCKYFCKGTDAVKSKQFCGTVIFFSPSFFWFPWTPPPWVGVFWVFLFVLFCIIHLVELILLAERVWNNISHVIFVEEKLFEFFFFFGFPYHVSTVSICHVQAQSLCKIFVFVNWFKYMEFYTGFLLCYICIMCRYDIFFTTFSILI